MAGVAAAIDYIADIGGQEGSRHKRLVRAMNRIKAYEMSLSEYFLTQATKVLGLKVYGITDIEKLDQRTPTFAVSLEGYTPEEVATELGKQEFYVWHGDYYAVAVMERLGLQDKGGLVRIGFVHYNTREEVDRVLDALTELAQQRQSFYSSSKLVCGVHNVYEKNDWASCSRTTIREETTKMPVQLCS